SRAATAPDFFPAEMIFCTFKCTTAVNGLGSCTYHPLRGRSSDPGAPRGSGTSRDVASLDSSLAAGTNRCAVRNSITAAASEPCNSMRLPFVYQTRRILRLESSNVVSAYQMWSVFTYFVPTFAYTGIGPSQSS